MQKLVYNYSMNDNLIDNIAFYNEMNDLLLCFNTIVNSLKYDTKGLAIIYVLIQKIVSNAYSANILIKEEQINEAKILLRSATETVILVTYLSKFQDKINDYLDESQILKVKNMFITYKMLRDGEVIDENGRIGTKAEVAQEIKKNFDIITNSAKTKLLKNIGIDDFIISDNSYDKIDKYFTKKFRPVFFKYKDMYEELDRIDFKIKDDKEEFSLKDIVYGFYNDSSQIAHGCIMDWNRKIKFNKREASYMFHFFIKTTLFLRVLLKDTINFNNPQIIPYVRKMKQANINLEKLVYGKMLNHEL